MCEGASSAPNLMESCASYVKQKKINWEFYGSLWGYRKKKKWFIQFSLVYGEEQEALCPLDDNMGWRVMVQKHSFIESASLNSAKMK